MNNLAKVLVIESEALIQLDIASILQTYGYQVVVADDGRDGLQLAEAELPDIILCDTQLPDISGFDVLKQLRSKDNLVQARFILLSTQSVSPTCRLALQHGANDALSKPITEAALLETIALHLR